MANKFVEGSIIRSYFEVSTLSSSSGLVLLRVKPFQQLSLTSVNCLALDERCIVGHSLLKGCVEDC